MDLIDRYIVAVGRHLPAPLQQDVVAELADSFRSEVEALTQKAGRPLTEGEQAELLKRHGHPWLMASRYLPQQHLIGPSLYPYYRRALAMVVFWIVLPITLIGGAVAAAYAQDTGHTWARALGAAWNGAIYSVGIVTIVFAILEHQRVRITTLDHWTPTSLPQPQDGRPVPRGESLFALIANITFLFLWTGLISLPAVAEFGAMSVRFEPAPVWTMVYFPIMLSVLVTIGVSLADLLRPWRTRLVSRVRITNALAFAGIVIALLRARHWVTIAADPAFADRAARTDYWVNTSIGWTLIVVLGVTLFELIYELRTLPERGEVAK
jgi:hypothetical protein